MIRPLRRDTSLVRNLEIFWEVRGDERSQREVAQAHGISQQRVSQIVRRMSAQVALGSSEEVEGVPQMAQLQYGLRIRLKQLERRRKNLLAAWEKSMENLCTVKQIEDAKGKRVETSYRNQHGDYRIDARLEVVEAEILETRTALYGRPWRGWEELDKMRTVLEGKQEQRGRKRRAAAVSGEARGPRGEEAQGPRGDGPQGPRGEGGAEIGAHAAGLRGEGGEGLDLVTSGGMVVGTVAVESVVAEAEVVDAAVVEVVAGAACAVPSVATAGEAMPSEAGEVAESAVVDERSSAAGDPQSSPALPQAEPVRKRPRAISKLTGKLIHQPEWQTPEFLIKHGLDPADFDGGVPATGARRWMTGPDPEEVLSRDVSRMTLAEYRQYQEDLRMMKLIGSYGVPDRR